MSFIARELTEKDKKWLEQFRLGTPFSGGSTPSYGKIIVEDKVTKAFLVCLGGQGYMTIEHNFYSDFPLIFYLIWNGYVLYIECHYDTYVISEEPKVYGVKYSIEKIRNESDCYPHRDIEVMKERVKNVLKQALSVYKKQHKGPYGNVEFIKMVDPICL